MNRSHQVTLFRTVANGDAIHRPALLLYTATAEEFNGYAVDDAKLNEILEATQKVCATGRKPKMYWDHGLSETGPRYSQKDVVGAVTGEFFTAEITADNLPSPTLSWLIGRTGLFCSEIKLTSEEFKAQYTAGVAGDLSVGIDKFGDFTGTPNAIFEVSGVGEARARGAQLFAATTFVEAMNDAAINREVWETLDERYSALMTTLHSIDGDEDVDNAAELKTQAVADYAQSLAAAVESISGDPASGDPEIFSRVPNMIDFISASPDGTVTLSVQKLRDYDAGEVSGKDLIKQIADTAKQAVTFAQPSEAVLKVQKENEQLQRQISFQALDYRAQSLVKAGKLTPVRYAELFGKADAEMESRLLLFTAALNKHPGNADAVAIEIETLERLDATMFAKVERGELDADRVSGDKDYAAERRERMGRRGQRGRANSL